MKIFTIEQDTNRITVHATAGEAEAVANAERFRHEAGLGKLAAHWPAPRLVEIWNSLPGVTPVKKFTNRQTAIARIWKAVQSLDQPSVAQTAEQPATALPALEGPADANVAPQDPRSVKKAARVGQPRTAARKAQETPDRSKSAMVLELLKREGGVTSKELIVVTGWQPHSVRGFISGTLGKKKGLTIVSRKGENGQRTYSIRA